mgnify:CR=1 FL=1|jgi:hypothetical protein
MKRVNKVKFKLNILFQVVDMSGAVKEQCGSDIYFSCVDKDNFEYMKECLLAACSGISDLIEEYYQEEHKNERE